MSTPKRPLTDQLDGLGEAITTAKMRVREMELERDRVQALVADATEAIIEAHSAADTAAATKAGKEREKLEGQLRDASERVEGAQRAAVKAEAARGVFASENVDQLLRERKPDADAAAEAVEEAIAALAEAQRQWDAVQSDHAAVLRFAGRSTEGLPAFPQALQELTRSARRVGQVDVPTPGRVMA